VSTEPGEVQSDLLTGGANDGRGDGRRRRSGRPPRGTTGSNPGSKLSATEAKSGQLNFASARLNPPGYACIVPAGGRAVAGSNPISPSEPPAKTSLNSPWYIALGALRGAKWTGWRESGPLRGGNV